MRASSFLPVLGVGLALAACTNQVAGPSGPTTLDDDLEQAVTFAVPSDVPSERVYLGTTNWVHTDETHPWHYGVFDLNEKARVLIELYDSNAWLPVGFKVYRVTAGGGLVHLGTIDGPYGYAAAVLSTRSGGSYVIESVGYEMNATLALDVSCTKNNMRCSPSLQPEELCGTRGVAGSCDEGLFCLIDEGCGYDDRGGSCKRPIQMCPAVYGPAVCGCDGVTYGTACSANAAGVNVSFQGACACDPLVYEKNLDEQKDVVGTWVWKGPYLQEDVTARLTLHADGTFGYEQVWDPQCLRVEPYCRRASRLFGMSGTWENLTFAVQLYPVMHDGVEVPLELAQSFSVDVNCEGSFRLSTTEMGEDRVFEQDRCADLECSDGEHCELQEVWCIQAPCPPLPTCVSDG